jgi:hypothetical protein
MIVAFDYETVELLSDGSTRASTEAYRPNFRISSAAFAYRDEQRALHTRYTPDEESTRVALETYADLGAKFVCHNAQFEKLVTRCRFPQLYPKIHWYADTMRLAQVYDNGGRELAVQEEQALFTDPADVKKKTRVKSRTGMGLANSVCRILGRKEDHKAEAYAWIRENVPKVRKGKEGAHLDALPPDVMERYNVADAVVTLELYEFTTASFDFDKYDWRLDHQLFLGTVDDLVSAKIRGVRVDRERVAAYIPAIESEIAAIAEEFRENFEEPIRRVERLLLLRRLRKLKTLRGRKKFLKRFRAGNAKLGKELRFNVGSNKQLSELFVGRLGIQAKFRTNKGAASFKSAHLSQWGEGGLILEKRRKRGIVMKQAMALLALSETDGRWHLDLRACGTSTGRFAGGKA